MIRVLARAGLSALLVASLALTGWAAVQIAREPLIRPLVERSIDEIAAAADRMLAQQATLERIAARLTALLSEAPRNWIAIEAVEAVAAERGIALLPDLELQRATAWDHDSGYLTKAGACLSCIWDGANCNLSQALICNAPVSLTPIGDLAGLARAGVAYGTGGIIDQIDLALSVVGLAATALAVASGGTSVTVKLGAGLGKMAHRMGLLSPRLARMITDALRAGVDLAALPAVRSGDDLARAIKTEALAPLAALASDLGRTAEALGPTETLHLLRYIDDGADARRLANAAQALGPRTLGRIEVLGKARLLRATLRWSKVTWGLLTGICGLLAALAGMLGGMAQSLSLRLLRRMAVSRH